MNPVLCTLAALVLTSPIVGIGAAARGEYIPESARGDRAGLFNPAARLDVSRFGEVGESCVA